MARGLAGVALVTSDAHAGLREAIAAVLPGATWQRCRTHFMRNLLTRVPKSAQPFVATMVHRGRGVWATNADRKGYSLSDIKQMGGWRTDAMPLRYIKGKPMEELQRLPAPLASIVRDFETTARRHRAGLRKAG